MRAKDSTRLLILKTLQINPGLSAVELADKIDPKIIKRATIYCYLSMYDKAGLITYKLFPKRFAFGKFFRNVNIKHYTINEMGLRSIAKLEETERKSISQPQTYAIQNELPFENEISQKQQNNPLTELQHKYEILLAGFIGLKENVKNGKSLEQSILHMGSKFEELLLNK